MNDPQQLIRHPGFEDKVQSLTTQLILATSMIGDPNSTNEGIPEFIKSFDDAVRRGPTVAKGEAKEVFVVLDDEGSPVKALVPSEAVKESGVTITVAIAPSHIGQINNNEAPRYQFVKPHVQALFDTALDQVNKIDLHMQAETPKNGSPDKVSVLAARKAGHPHSIRTLEEGNEGDPFVNLSTAVKAA